jgi:hypothetical protein
LIDSFRANRWIRTLNLVLQAILFLTFIGGLNYLAGVHVWRKDLTRYRRYSLSPETLSYLGELSRPVHIVITSDEKSDNPEVDGLLREYVNATEGNVGGQVTVENVDIFQDRRKTEKYGVDRAGSSSSCAATSSARSPSTTSTRSRTRCAKSFIGEQAVTAAILDVSNPDRKKIYFLVGHAELRPDDVDPVRGLSMVREQLRLRNYDVDTLDLAAARKVPADAALLVSVNPVDSFSPFEQELLRQYLGVAAGRLILFLAPNTNPGLKDLLIDDWGILVDDDVIFDLGSDNISEDGDLVIRALRSIRSRRSSWTTRRP